MTTKDATTVKVGDWVRFMSGGRLVVGVVAYVQPNGNYLYAYTTDAGAVAVESILEVR